ncbi:MAG: VWA domain-containing protein [Bacteroidia bacterium]
MQINIEQRWKLVLGSQSDANNRVSLKQMGGGGEGEGEGQNGEGQGIDMEGMAKSLDALYDSERKAGLGGSNPNVNRWLGDIRKYFPASVVSIMQKDAVDKLGIERMLMEPEFLETVEVNVELVAQLLSLGRGMPDKVKNTARLVVTKIVKQLEEKLKNPMRQAVQGALSRSVRNPNPKLKEIDWDKTIRANLKHYQEDYKTVVPEKLIGYGKKGQSLKDIILCLDQSGSMGTSVVYSGIFGSVMASLKSVTTHLVVFDTAVADLTQDLQDPIDLLFGVQLGGGTDIHKALTYCQTLIKRPNDTIFILISDLYEGGNEKAMLRKVAEIKESGVNFVTLLALNDEGAPYYDKRVATAFAQMEIPSFACSPDLFPDLMATVIQKKDIYQWMSQHDVEAK